MAVEFQMPKLGLTMEEGTITAWLVEEGAQVEAGDPELTIQTDKVESDVEASHSGRLHMTGSVGDLFECGERIGWFLEPGEEPPADAPTGAGSRGSLPASDPIATASVGPGSAPSSHTGANGRDGTRLLASPNARRVAADLGVDLGRVAGTGPGGRIVSEDVFASRRSAPTSGSPTSGSPTMGGPPPGGWVEASAAAVQTAARLGVDLGEVAPARQGARLDRSDVERHVRERLAATQGESARAVAEAPLLQEPTGRIPLTGMRGTIAQRMHESLQAMAQLTLTMDVVMDGVVAHRAAAEPDGRPGYTDYVVAAAAQALGEHPLINSQVAGGAVNLLGEVNVGVAVALDGGLVVPVVRNADQLAFGDLCAETTRLAEAARSGNLAMADIEGGTFSVTALGMYGVDAFTPVINPPNTAILGVGRIRDDVRFSNGAPVPAKVLTLSLTWDHRAYDGAPAAEFAASVRDMLEGWGDG